MDATSKTKTLSLSNYTTYMWATVFIACNVILPQICHAVNLGGQVFLPILLFTLIASARYGVVCGLVTAILSPVASTLITGMPSGEILVSLIAKSLMIVALVGTWRERGSKFSIISILSLIVLLQVGGFALDSLILPGSFAQAFTNVTMSWPGILIQTIALWAVTRK